MDRIRRPWESETQRRNSTTNIPHIHQLSACKQRGQWRPAPRRILLLYYNKYIENTHIFSTRHNGFTGNRRKMAHCTARAVHRHEKQSGFRVHQHRGEEMPHRASQNTPPWDRPESLKSFLQTISSDKDAPNRQTISFWFCALVYVCCIPNIQTPSSA